MKLAILRRSFLEGVGLSAAGLAFGLFPDDADAQPKPGGAPPVKGSPAKDGGLRPNVFVHIALDGLVTLTCHRSEMGQGIRSSLPVLLADELGADMARVAIVQAEGDKKYGDQNTDGSRSIRGIYEDMRRVAATARTMLVATAAKRWKVDPKTVSARAHLVTHTATKRSFTFAELVEEASQLPVPDPKSVVLRPESELEHLGTDLPLLDGPAFVTGKALYGADVRLPEMLVAVIARPPVVGGKVKAFDPAPALAIPGVKKVIELPAPKPPFGFQPLGGVAVLATNTYAAIRGRAALTLTWDDGANATYDSVAFKEKLLSSVRASGKSKRSVGDVDKALKDAAKRISAEYYLPHLAHAAMEPPAAIASFKDGKCEVWASTQNPQSARTEVSKTLGIQESDVRVNVTYLGGGFGRKSKADYVAEAAFLSREAKVPVRVQWTRTDDLHHAYYHTVSAQRLEAGLDAQGKVVAWLHRTTFPPIPSTFGPSISPSDGELGQGVTDLPLAIPNVRAEAVDAQNHVRIGWLRSVCNVFHAFSVGTFLDEIAHARGLDPKDSLLGILGPPRIVGPEELGIEKVWNYGAPIEKHPIDTGRTRTVVERVTEMADWNNRKKNGRSLGLAVHRSFLTYVGAVISVVKDGDKPRIDEAWVVVDAGTIVNRERVRSQMEGAVIFGISIALYSEITMKNGRIDQTNFRDYRLARIADAPRKIHVDIVKSDKAPGGIGEPGVPPIAPAIGNAIFALSGVRVRELPMAKLKI